MLLALDILFKLTVVLVMLVFCGMAAEAHLERKKYAKLARHIAAGMAKAKLEGALYTLGTLKFYLRHDEACSTRHTRADDCTCGLSAAVDVVSGIDVSQTSAVFPGSDDAAAPR